ncbi:hypothetical protein DSO57_1024540 [Entomophthora muscae]|uniref:Uncharacterized protein n=1 Tax=Entomophthora muscae TaxID=34485 RepID=A0ACC2UMF0_9FUNG|nr:hypothetical protein DSO57_1024540 [Entomophthora muscae]
MGDNSLDPDWPMLYLRPEASCYEGLNLMTISKLKDNEIQFTTDTDNVCRHVISDKFLLTIHVIDFQLQDSNSNTLRVASLQAQLPVFSWAQTRAKFKFGETPEVNQPRVARTNVSSAKGSC